MNDRFKFRGIHPVLGELQEIKYIDFIHNTVDFGDGDIFKIEEVNIQQSAGLKDKNEKLIFEGDVVEFYSQSLLDAMSRKGLARRVGQVVWNDEFLKFDVIVGSKAVPDLCKETDDNNFEVIGNIYENKDLLNENS